MTAPEPTGRCLGPDTMPADREELLRIWDALSHEGRKMVLIAALAAAKEEGLPVGDGPVVRTGKL